MEEIAPLLNGKANRELTVKMIHEEIVEWWMNDWGWIHPLISVIDSESRSNDRIMVDLLWKIHAKMKGSSVVDLIRSYSGFSKEEKERYLERAAHKTE